MKKGKTDSVRQLSPWVAVLIPAIYFLSYGPMTRIYYQMPMGSSYDLQYETIYAPIEWMAGITPLDGLVDWYENLWLW